MKSKNSSSDITSQVRGFDGDFPMRHATQILNCFVPSQTLPNVRSNLHRNPQSPTVVPHLVHLELVHAVGLQHTCQSTGFIRDVTWRGYLDMHVAVVLSKAVSSSLRQDQHEK